MGFYLDDHSLFWWLGDLSHPQVFANGRFAVYTNYWMLWKVLETNPGAFHLLLLVLHLLVVNELFTLFRSLHMHESTVAISVLFYALFPVYYEVVYWAAAFIYLQAALLLLLALRLFRFHLKGKGIIPIVGSGLLYFLACGTLEQTWCLCVSSR